VADDEPVASSGAALDKSPLDTKTRRTVAGRLLVSFAVVLAAFAITVGWSLLALREAARDATLVRGAYVPLLSTIGEALAGQNVMNTQLNHITAAKNPADVRQWLETARRLRPMTLKKLRDEANAGLADVGALHAHLLDETSRLEQDLSAGGAQFDQLFQALADGDAVKAERLRDQLVAVETDGAKRLRALRDRVAAEMTALTEAAQAREQRSIQFLIGLSALTLIVGLITTFYARRVLRPLTHVTHRARAVATGDLTPREIVATDDEIGELAKTFEDMVAAIRRARQELVQAERLATIGKMAAHITHEVRNPLSSISLNLELLEEELLDSAHGPPSEGAHESRQLMSAIKKEVERLSLIAEQYLSAVREPKLQLESENVDDLVRECHAFVRPELERAGIASEVEVDGEIPRVEVDEAQFRQALVNLVRNAREALSKGGEVILRVACDRDVVRICVDDDGPGIPEDRRAAIFDPFYTTKRHGTGLGLAVTKSIVEAHGGTLACLAREGGGTRFEIKLPYVTREDAAPARRWRSRPP
jgi:signal transduction histidine kinase